ncbi:MAG: peptidoglycan-binding domain-containing protein, partial [Candidatus Didemnitutus sp.]|nr:peptidoglycan-binding domain-containing protein [Candidatus Didemnitutus sp.]
MIAGLPADARLAPGDELPLEVARTYDQIGAQSFRLVNVSWRYEPAARFQPQPIQRELVSNHVGKFLRLEVDARILTDGRQHLLPPGQSDLYTVAARKPYPKLLVQLGERTLFTGNLPLVGASKFLLIFRDDQLEILRSSTPPGFLRLTRRSPLVLIVPVLRLLPILLIAVALRAPLLAQTESVPIESATETAAFQLRPVADWLEAQVELHRRGFSCGSIDGVRGPQTTAALLAFQRSAYLDETGELDRPTRESLLLTAPPLTEHVFTAEELGPLQPVPDTWLGKSERDRLGYATAIEFAGERYRASPRHLQRLNPGFDWEAVLPGTKITVPAIAPFRTTRIARHVHVKLAERAL